MSVSSWYLCLSPQWVDREWEVNGGTPHRRRGVKDALIAVVALTLGASEVQWIKHHEPDG